MLRLYLYINSFNSIYSALSYLNLMMAVYSDKTVKKHTFLSECGGTGASIV
jgi:hypothetical protein